MISIVSVVRPSFTASMKRRCTSIAMMVQILSVVMASTAVVTFQQHWPTVTNLSYLKRSIPAALSGRQGKLRRSFSCFLTNEWDNLFEPRRGNTGNSSPSSYTTTGSTGTNNNSNSNIDLSMVEEHVIARAKSQLDTSRVLQALSADEPTARMFDNTNNVNWNPFSNRSPPSSQSRQLSVSQRRQTTDDLLYDHERDQHRRPISQYQVSTAAAIVCGTMAFIVIHNTYISIFVSIGVFILALLNDDDEDDTNSLSGALVRILGRTTIRSVRASQPKLKAIARAVITGEEQVQYLQQTIQSLQAENKILQQENFNLLLWKERHILINSQLLPQYTLSQLKDMAKVHNVPVSGSKLDLIERLLDAKVITL